MVQVLREHGLRVFRGPEASVNRGTIVIGVPWSGISIETDSFFTHRSTLRIFKCWPNAVANPDTALIAVWNSLELS